MLRNNNSTDLTINHFRVILHTSKQLNESLKMANTKQMQERAKQRKILAQAELIRTDLEQKICVAKNDTFILPAGPKMLGNMVADFKKDYIAMGDTADGDGSAEKFCSGNRKVFIISYKGEVAGFMSLYFVKKGTGSATFGEASLVETLYVKPKFRGLHLSSVMYRYAMENHNAEGIELSYQRITGKEAYWSALGFTRIIFVPEQLGTKQSLAVISTNPEIGLPLNAVVVRTMRSVCNTTDTRLYNSQVVINKINQKIKCGVV
jgi:N-acetylglutamate synthase-like GNAT family acetyltransferase